MSPAAPVGLSPAVRQLHPVSDPPVPAGLDELPPVPEAPPVAPGPLPPVPELAPPVPEV